MQALLGMKNLRGLILFDLVCHLGTLLAIFYFFRQQIASVFSTHGKLFFLICLGTLPLFFMVPFKTWIDYAFSSPAWLWLAFFTTGILLLLGEAFGKSKGNDVNRGKAFAIGCAQAVAVIPGISRSGTTISIARMIGVSRENAVVFSFLLAIPAILGSTTLELLHIFTKSTPAIHANVGIFQYILGFALSFITGIISLGFIMRIVLNDALKYFAWYCFAVSIFCLLYFVIL